MDNDCDLYNSYNVKRQGKGNSQSFIRIRNLCTYLEIYVCCVSKQYNVAYTCVDTGYTMTMRWFSDIHSEGEA